MVVNLMAQPLPSSSSHCAFHLPRVRLPTTRAPDCLSAPARISAPDAVTPLTSAAIGTDATGSVEVRFSSVLPPRCTSVTTSAPLGRSSPAQSSMAP